MRFGIFAGTMGKAVLLQLLFGALTVVLSASVVKAEDPYKFYTWTVTYGTLSPLGIPQQVGFKSQLPFLYCQFWFWIVWDSKDWIFVMYEGDTYQWSVSWA